MGAHALLSPSGADKWLVCPPSARLEDRFPDTESEYAAEGTLAHRLGEILIAYGAKLISEAVYNKQLKAIKSDPLYSGEMLEYMNTYADFVLEKFNEAKVNDPHAVILLEQKTDLSQWIPDGFGTRDVSIHAGHTLTIIDLKYGKGVPVSAVDNKQMKVYAAGALRELYFMYDILQVNMIIYQPRINNVTTFILSTDQLFTWAREVLKPGAELAFSIDLDAVGPELFKTGDHCRFCRARPVCRAYADIQLEIAKHEFKAPPLLQDGEISDVLTRMDALVSWVKEVYDYALRQALNGQHWPGFKLVEGRSNRKIVDGITAAALLRTEGLTDDKIYQPAALKTITELEKLIGKKRFAELLNGVIVKPPGAPTLVPEDDKRPALDGLQSAKNDFAEPIPEND